MWNKVKVKEIYIEEAGEINQGVDSRDNVVKGGATVLKVGGQILTPNFLASGGQNIAIMAKSA